jgi:hypothetical protein
LKFHENFRKKNESVENSRIGSSRGDEGVVVLEDYVGDAVMVFRFRTRSVLFIEFIEVDAVIGWRTAERTTLVDSLSWFCATVCVD